MIVRLNIRIISLYFLVGNCDTTVLSPYLISTELFVFIMYRYKNESQCQV